MTESPRALRLAAAVDPLGHSRYRATLSPYYTIGGDHPNGGYMQCVIAAAALAEADAQGINHPHVTAQTTNYIGSPALRDVELHVEVRKAGRSVSFLHVLMSQDGNPMTESVITLGRLSDEPHIRYVDGHDFSPQHYSAVPRVEPTGDVSIRYVVDQVLDPSCTPWTRGETSESGEILGWLSLNDGEGEWDPWSLLFASDALPPATFPLGSHMWTPTLQLTSYIRAIPRSKWLRARQWCVVVADNTVDERCELWDETGQLVVVASQLAMVRFPSS